MTDLLASLWLSGAVVWAALFGLERSRVAANPDEYLPGAQRTHARRTLVAPIWPLVLAWLALGALGKHLGYAVRDAVSGGEDE